MSRRGLARMPALRRGWPVLLALAALSGCADTGYYWQAAAGHLELMQAARPVAQWLDDPATPPAMRDRLRLAQAIRDFASSELALPDNGSYRRYGDLGRSAAVWNVVAAPADSLSPKTWCFAVVGCVSYRGYFQEAPAREEAASLVAQGWEADAYPVPAYSTLGWSNWLGGDPLLNTFIGYPEGELARLIFHELAHQVAYAEGDTLFNESFATAVERLGAERWLRLRAGETARRDYAEFDARRTQFRELTRATRAELAQVYARQTPESRADLVQAKAAVMARFRARYAELRAQWGGDPARHRGFDRWVERANNASFALQGAYDDLVPAFEALHRAQGGDLRRFYDAVRTLSRLPREQRHQQLKETPGA